jgi:hypothetical protein
MSDWLHIINITEESGIVSDSFLLKIPVILQPQTAFAAVRLFTVVPQSVFDFSGRKEITCYRKRNAADTAATRLIPKRKTVRIAGNIAKIPTTSFLANNRRTELGEG